MYTRWGEALSDQAQDEYPRPQLRREEWQSLNGEWSYAITPLSAPRPQQWQGSIRVPFCLEAPLGGVEKTLQPGQRLWYQRKCALTNLSDTRTLLHFGAVDYECTLWINDALVGSHTGGFDPFFFDISDYVTSAEMEILLAVTDATSRSDQMRGKQHLNPQRIWYTPVSGIWQTVWLEQVPASAHIEELRIEPNPGCDGIKLTACAFRPSRDPTLAVVFTVSLRGEVVAETIAPLDRIVPIELAEAELWSPDHPTLYDVQADLVCIENPLPDDNDDERPAALLRHIPLRGETELSHYAAADVSSTQRIDRVQSYFAMRRITVGPHPDTRIPSLLLNDAPIFQLGTLDQGWWPDGLHTPPNDAAMIYEIEFLKAAGFNTLRKHIKVEPARYYYHCDRLGILVWQDIPSGFLPAQFVAPNDEGEAIRNSRSAEQYELEMQRIVNRLRHHPSIVMWVLHNEGWGQFETERLTSRLRDLDPDRLVNAISGWRDVGVGDVIDRHDYNAEPAAPEPDNRRALVVGEYGGVGWPIEGHLWNPDMDNWGYQTLDDRDQAHDAYTKVTNTIVDLAQTQGLSAAIYTQTSDVEGEVNGLLTYDRAIEKFTREWLAQQHAPLHRG